jgi:hypothetical protein
MAPGVAATRSDAEESRGAPDAEQVEVTAEEPVDASAADDAPAQQGMLSPNLAAALSIVPGLGQLYNRQGGKAGFFFLATLLTIGPAVALVATGRNNAIDIVANQGAATYLLFVFISLIVFLALFCLGLGFWASAVIDARRSADRLNRGVPGEPRWWFFRF